MTLLISKIARIMAVLGGVILTLLVLLVCVSVIGRLGNSVAHMPVIITHFHDLSEMLLWLGIGPIAGDFELVEAGMSFVIFAFLPWCQLQGGHARVDVFAIFFPNRVNHVILRVSEWVLTLVTGLITWRLAVGMMDKIRYEETTYILQFPAWWTYAASLFAAIIALTVSLHTSIAHSLSRGDSL